MSVTTGPADPTPLIAQGLAGFARRARWGIGEIVFWLVAVASVFLLPSKHLILTEITILALFALSLDLILGYAGIVSLGHAAFFGLGAYTAGLIAKYGWGEPVTGLIAATLVAGIAGYAASLIGISDVAGKYYLPGLGAFLIYLVMIGLLMWRPAGLFGRR